MCQQCHLMVACPATTHSDDYSLELTARMGQPALQATQHPSTFTSSVNMLAPHKPPLSSQHVHVAQQQNHGLWPYASLRRCASVTPTRQPQANPQPLPPQLPDHCSSVCNQTLATHCVVVAQPAMAATQASSHMPHSLSWCLLCCHHKQEMQPAKLNHGTPSPAHHSTT